MSGPLGPRDPFVLLEEKTRIADKTEYGLGGVVGDECFGSRSKSMDRSSIAECYRLSPLANYFPENLNSITSTVSLGPGWKVLFCAALSAAAANTG